MLILVQAIKEIVKDHDFPDLEKFHLNRAQWKLLEDYQEILQVSMLFLNNYYANTNHQVPHAFQDILGAETTPTLCYAILGFSAFMEKWNQLKDKNPDWASIIDPGLEKLQEYVDEIPKVPAYVLAMGEIL